MSAQDLETVAQRYFAAWERRDPDAIAALHTDDTRFWVHNGGEAAVGRAAARDAFAALFELLPEFGFDVYRVLYGPDFWVLDWAVSAVVGGRPIRFDALDVVSVTAAGLVSRKDTFVDAAGMQAAFEAAA